MSAGDVCVGGADVEEMCGEMRKGMTEIWRKQGGKIRKHAGSVGQTWEIWEIRVR